MTTKTMKYERMYNLSRDDVLDVAMLLVDFLDQRPGSDHRLVHMAMVLKRAEVERKYNS